MGAFNSLYVDIGCGNIKIIYGRYSFGRLFVKKFGLLPTPSGSFKNGSILNIDKVAGVINDFIRANKIRTGKISFTIHSTEIILRNLEIPVLNPRAVQESVAYEMEQFAKGRFKELKLCYEIVQKDNKKYKVLVAMVPRNIIDEYDCLSEKLKLGIECIDIAAKAELRLLGRKSRQFLVIDIGKESIRISLFSKGMFYTEREITYSENGNAKKSGSEAKNTSIGLEIRTESLLKHIEQIIGFHNINFGSRVERAYIIGGGEVPGQLVEHLEKDLKLVVENGKIDLCNDLIIKRNLKGDFRTLLPFFVNTLGVLIRK